MVVRILTGRKHRVDHKARALDAEQHLVELIRLQDHGIVCPVWLTFS